MCSQSYAMCLPWLIEEVIDQSFASLGNAQIATLSNWLANGGGPTLHELKQLRQEEREGLLDYIQEMDLYAQVEAGGCCFVLVHIGLEHFPEKPLEEYELTDFLFCRHNPDQVYYEDRYLVYGHTPTRLLRQQVGEPPTDSILRRGA